MKLCSVARLLLALVLAPVALSAEDLPSWTPIGPDGGDVRTLATSPAQPGWIFAGLQHFGHGLYRSADRGRSWEAAAGFLDLSVLDLAISADGRAVFAATAGGLLRSTDGGATWETTGPADGETPRVYTRVQTHPRRPGLVLTVRERTLFRSTDQGATWSTRPEWPEDVQTLVFAPGSDVVYAGSSSSRIWKSTDAGRTWRPSSQGLPVDIRVWTLAIDPGNPRILYAGLLQSRRALYKSTDGGATWRLSQRGLAVEGKVVQPVLDLAVDPVVTSTVYAIVGDALFRSLNHGRDWARLARLPGHFVNDLEATPYGLLAATPGGVYLSTDRGLTWQGRNAGLAATSIFAMDLDPQDPPRLYATDVWEGIFRSARRGRPWLRLSEVEESRFVGPRPVRVDPEEPQTVYTGTSGGVAKSTDGGRTWAVHGGLGCLIPREIVLDPREPRRLYASGRVCGPTIRACVVYRSLDAGETWECVRGLPDPLDSKVLEVDPFTSALYILTGSGEIWKSADQGATWSRLFDTLLAARSFAASLLVEGTVWAGLPGGVARSRDGGETWGLFNAGLPAGAAVVALTPDPVDPETLYAATRGDGVFRSTDAGETWTPVGTWPAGIQFLGDLLIDPADPSILYAGTEGLGVLKFDQED